MASDAYDPALSRPAGTPAHGLADHSGARLLAHFVEAGFRRADPAILQPTDVFLDQAGEDIRGRLYLTSDASGSELCLRPEFTVPLARDYLSSPEAGKPVDFCYLGPVFRLRPGANGEFIQAGVESIGRTDILAADSDILGVAVEAATAAGAPQLAVSFGDAALFSAFLAALDLPPAWARRIRNGLSHGQSLEMIFAVPAHGSADDHSGVLAALEGADKQGARALVEDLLSIAGISSVGGRSVGEIAERFLEQASQRSAPPAAPQAREWLSGFLAVEGDPDHASAALRALADRAGLDVRAALDAFDTRVNFLAARGLAPETLRFSARLSLRLNYYTGFVFEAHAPGAAVDKPTIRGGRYDRLLASLGARMEIPAVGAAVWVERLGGEGARA